jgi:tape measure domain-containing protein
MANINAGSVVWTLDIDDSKFKSALAQSRNNIEGYGSNAKKQTSIAAAGFGALGAAAKGAAVGGLAALAVVIGKNIPGAIRRIDTLVAFPKVLKSLGATGDEASASTDKLAEKLRGLPTPLSAGAAGVQRLVTAGLTVPKATDAFLGLNNALIASGAEAPQVESAMLQISQALSRGKFDAQEWNAIASNMPVLMGALQKSTGKTSQELRKMFREDPKALMQKIIELNEKGGKGLSTLEDTAREATGGIGTAFANMDNAIQRGMENIVKAIGGGDLETGQKKISSAISSAGKIIGNSLVATGNAIAGFISFLSKNEWALWSFRGAVIGLSIAMIGSLAFALKGTMLLLGKMLLVLTPFIVVGALIAGVAYLIKQNWDRISPTVELVKNAFIGFWQVIQPLREFIAGQFLTAWRDIRFAVSQLLTTIKPFMPILKRIGVVILVAVVAPLAIAVAAFVVAIGIVVAVITAFVRLIGWVARVGSSFLSLKVAVVSAMYRFITAIVSGVGRANSVFGSIRNTIIRTMLSLPSFMYNIGVLIIRGLINGIGSMANAVRNKVAAIANGIKDRIKSALRIQSPSKVFIGYGKNIGQGLVNGIEASKSIVENSVGGLAGATTATMAPSSVPTVDTNALTGGNTSNQTVTIGTVVLGDKSAAQEFFKQLGQDQLNLTMGLTPVQGAR